MYNLHSLTELPKNLVITPEIKQLLDYINYQENLIRRLEKQLDVTERISMSVAFNYDTNKALEEAKKYCQKLCITDSGNAWTNYKETEFFEE